MGKVLVLYDSATGHTRKMAEEVAQGARQVSGTDLVLTEVQPLTKSQGQRRFSSQSTAK